MTGLGLISAIQVVSELIEASMEAMAFSAPGWTGHSLDEECLERFRVASEQPLLAVVAVGVLDVLAIVQQT